MITEIVLFLIVVLMALKLYVHRQYSYWKDTGAPNVTPNFPYGNAKEIGKKYHFAEKLALIYKEYKTKGPFCGLHLGLLPVAVATDLDFIRNVLVKDFHNFPDRGVYYNKKSDPLSAHLFNIDSEPWKKLRSKLTPTFTSGKMKYMFPTIVEVAERMHKLINVLVTNDSTIEIRDLLSKYTTDVIGSCAFGIECDSLFGKDAVFQKMGRKSFERSNHKTIVRLFFTKFKKLGHAMGIRFVLKDVEAFFKNVVQDTIRQRKTMNIERSDFMQILIKLMHDDNNGQEPLTMDEVCAQAFVFFLAGFETSSTALTYCLYELSKNQVIQQRVRQNVTDVLSNHDGLLTYEAIKDMKYLEQTLKETLRRYPPLAHLSRSIKEDYQVPGTKLTLPKNGMVVIPVLGIQNDPDIYPNPSEFNPDRFSEEEIRKRHPYSFLAFGEGPRNCIGLRFGMMQAQIGLAIIIKNFELSLSPKTPPLGIVTKNFLLGPDSDVWIQFKNTNSI